MPQYETTKAIGCGETKVTHKRLSPRHTPHSLLQHSTVSYCPLVLDFRVTVSTTQEMTQNARIMAFCILFGKQENM